MLTAAAGGPQVSNRGGLLVVHPTPSMEPIQPLLMSTRSGVDQQANRGVQSDPGATLNPARSSGSQGVTPFLKVTAAALFRFMTQHVN